MNLLRRHIWTVCALAIFLMAGGQVLHACADMRCDESEAAETQSSCPDEQDCPIGQCCHAHLCIGVAMIEHSGFLFRTSPSSLLAVKSETWGEGPSREIDHPPQVS